MLLQKKLDLLKVGYSTEMETPMDRFCKQDSNHLFLLLKTMVIPVRDGQFMITKD
jgi:hypothetical protein